MRYLLVLLLICSSPAVFSQYATYKLVNKSNGSYCTIAVRQTADLVEANILASWNTRDGKYGEYTGRGKISGNKCTLQSDSAACMVKLSFTHEKLEVLFEDCMDNLIPEDFSGTYNKLTDHIRGEYIVLTDNSPFYSRPDIQSREKGAARKSQVLNIEEVFPGNWGFATVMQNGRQIFGYVKLSDLRLKHTYLYD